MIGVERITRLLVRSTVYEQLYIELKSAVSVRRGLEQALVELYTAVLGFLACAKRYLNQNIASKLFTYQAVCARAYSSHLANSLP